MSNAANAQMIIDAFNSQTYVSDRMDVQHTPLYDTLTFPAATVINENSAQFFTNVGSNSGKTPAQTNMGSSQKLSAPEAFSVFAVRLRWSEDANPLDLVNIINGMALQLFLGAKVYQQAPLWHFNAGGGLNVMQASSVAPAGTSVYPTTYTGNGTPSRQAMHKLAIPIVIENGMNFYARLVGNPVALITAGQGGTGLSLQLLLDGLYARGVQ